MRWFIGWLIYTSLSIIWKYCEWLLRPHVLARSLRLAYRQEWDIDLRAYLKSLDEQKPIVFCGDLNVAHNEIGKEAMYT